MIPREPWWAQTLRLQVVKMTWGVVTWRVGHLILLELESIGNEVKTPMGEVLWLGHARSWDVSALEKITSWKPVWRTFKLSNYWQTWYFQKAWEWPLTQPSSYYSFMSKSANASICHVFISLHQGSTWRKSHHVLFFGNHTFISFHLCWLWSHGLSVKQT